jgi:hypothetical protein
VNIRLQNAVSSDTYRSEFVISFRTLFGTQTITDTERLELCFINGSITWKRQPLSTVCASEFADMQELDVTWQTEFVSIWCRDCA